MDITQHAKERYAERIMGITDINEIKQYAIINEEKIQEDLSNMVAYGKLLYTGKIDNYTATRIYCNRFGWMVILDGKEDRVITFYKVDLGLGEDLNCLYVKKVYDKIDDLEEDLIEISESNDAELSEINEEQALIREKIKEYNSLIKSLENRVNVLSEYRNSLKTKRTLKETELRDTVSKLVAKIKI